MKRNDKVKGVFGYNHITGDNLNYAIPVNGTSTGTVFYTSGGTEYEVNSGGTGAMPILASIIVSGYSSVVKTTGVTTYSYTAKGIYDNASVADVTAAAYWTVSNNKATIANGLTPGVLTPLLTGSTVVTATITNHVGTIITGTKTVTITF